MAITKIYKRKICATLHRKAGKATEVIWVRYYHSVTNALKKGVEEALLTGQPGDVLELSHSNHGFQIATVKLTVGAKSIFNLAIEVHKDLIDES